MFVKLSSSEALKGDEKSRDPMAGMLFESLFLLHSGQKDITKIVTFLSLYFFSSMHGQYCQHNWFQCSPFEKHEWRGFVRLSFVWRKKAQSSTESSRNNNLNMLFKGLMCPLHLGHDSDHSFAGET